MFSERGLAAVLNDDILDSVFLLGNAVGGVTCMLVAYAYAKAVGANSVDCTMLTSLGFFVGECVSVIANTYC